MNDDDIFYHIYSASAEGCDLTKDADCKAKSTWLCSGCNCPKPSTGAIDVSIRVVPGKEPLTAAIGWGIPIVSKELLTAIGSDLVERDLLLGRVFGPDGKELNGFVTFRGKHRLIIRGSESVSHRKCVECGRDVYFAMDKNYLYPSPLPGVDLFESDLCGLVMTKGAFLRANLEACPAIWIDKLEVAEVSKDSLGELHYA